MYSLRIIGAVLVIAAAILVALIYNAKDRAVYPEEMVSKVIAKSRINIADSVFIVTGSTSGLGQSIATELYSLGGTVVVASRNLTKCARTIKEIKAQHPTSPGKLDYFKLDLADLDTVNPFVEWFKTKYDKLTALVNNAGIHYGDRVVDFNSSITSPQGYDELFSTNYFGHFLLTHQLLPMIKKGRVVNIASSYHYQADVQPLVVANNELPPAADPKNDGFFHRKDSYGNSKLAQILHARELQRRLDEGGNTQVKVVALCPGWVRTNIIPEGLLGDLLRTLAFSPRAGILTSMMAIFDPSLEGGEFLTNTIPPLSNTPFFFPILKIVSLSGLRSFYADIFALLMAMTQAWSYGYHDIKSSPESYNEDLAAKLFDWSEQELRIRGYIQQ